MIEITAMEAFLFCWAVLATAFALKIHDDLKTARQFAGMLIDNPNMAIEIKTEVKKYQEQK